MKPDHQAAVGEEGPPDLLTIEEAGAVLRVGRSKAYDLARQSLANGGDGGMPILRLERQPRVRRVPFEEWIGGPITWPIPARHHGTLHASRTSTASSKPDANATPNATASRNPARKPRATDRTQLSLLGSD
ncbi:MAG: hypothetical protein JWP32_2513 [Schumannella sp.]|nr:hypothetical protein [Schumannella sp.]